MYILMLMSFLCLMICFMMMLIILIISKKKMNDREKMSPFECGFDPFNSSRLPFSLQFFLITLIFLIFDVEITLMFPMIFSMKINSLINWMFSIMIFILILILGLIHEWNEGALEWKS